MRDVVMTRAGPVTRRASAPSRSRARRDGADRRAEGSNWRARGSRDHAWFIAFAPVEAPTIALAVLVEHAGGGGGKFAARGSPLDPEHYSSRATPDRSCTTGPTTGRAHATSTAARARITGVAACRRHTRHATERARRDCSCDSTDAC
jgi:hypothetical protein